MIVKDVSFTPYYLKLLCLANRLDPYHKKCEQVRDRIRREQSGYIGEKRVLYPLKKLDFPNFVLHNTRLQTVFSNKHFQMDFLLVTSNFILIIESKNMSGEVMMKEGSHQIFHHDKAYDDPINQVEEQKFQLVNWLEQRSYGKVPIETVVVMTSPNVRMNIHPSHEEHVKKIIPLAKLPAYIRTVNEQYNQRVLSINNARQLAYYFKECHEDYDPDILERFGVASEELLQGVTCEKCKFLTMVMSNLRWRCTKCGHVSRDGVHTAFKDYYLLKGNTIINREFMQFTGITSRHTAKSMLNKFSVKKEGIKRSTRYFLDFNYERDFNYLKKK
ncbi:nuclease-related domain-containing protein [Alkalibacillus haloalkaliphilus]|uniref:nuclease-related domain-containing protein n=1 Tax=Alkalibacillus haloalkaliphilus TaxID=94136 RepID=UPI0002D6DF61|nr:nuclease-related domain-containing protein [Alkalibacillus haloalkaliphilus]